MDHSNKTSKNSIPQSPAQYVILDVGIPTPANITTNVLTVSIIFNIAYINDEYFL